MPEKGKILSFGKCTIEPKFLCTNASESAQIVILGYILLSQELVCILACRKVAKLLAAVVVRNCMLGVGQAAICQRLVQQYTYSI